MVNCWVMFTLYQWMISVSCTHWHSFVRAALSRNNCCKADSVMLVLLMWLEHYLCDCGRKLTVTVNCLCCAWLEILWWRWIVLAVVSQDFLLSKPVCQFSSSNIDRLWIAVVWIAVLCCMLLLFMPCSVYLSVWCCYSLL